MFIENHRPVYRISPMIDIHALKKDCKDKADLWECTYRAQRGIKHHPGIFAQNRINLEKWLKSSISRRI